MLQLGDVVDVLSHADPKSKAEIYAELGLNITHDHEKRVVVASAQPCATDRVGEPTRTFSYQGSLAA